MEERDLPQLCPLCSLPQEDLSTHLDSFHSKQEIIKAISGNISLTPSNATVQVGNVPQTTILPSGTLSNPLGNSFFNAESSSISTTANPVGSCSPLVSPENSLVCNTVSNNSQVVTPLQIGSIRPQIMQNLIPGPIQSPTTLLCRQTENVSNSYFVTSPNINGIKNVYQPYVNNVNAQSLLSPNSDRDNNVSASNLLSNVQLELTSQKTILHTNNDRNTLVNSGCAPVNQQPLVCFLPVPTFGQPALMGNNLSSFNNIPISGIVPQVIQINNPDSSNLIQTNSVSFNNLQGASQPVYIQSPIPAKSVIVDQSQENLSSIGGTSENNESEFQTVSKRLANASSTPERSEKAVIELGKNIKISLPKDVLHKRDKLRQIINRELVHALLINDSDDDDQLPETESELNSSDVKPKIEKNDSLLKTTVNKLTIVPSSSSFKSPIINSGSECKDKFNCDTPNRFFNEPAIEEPDSDEEQIGNMRINVENESIKAITSEKGVNTNMFATSLSDGFTDDHVDIGIFEEAEDNITANEDSVKTDLETYSSKDENINTVGSSNFNLINSSHSFKTYSRANKIKKYIEIPTVCRDSNVNLVDNVPKVELQISSIQEDNEELIDDPDNATSHHESQKQNNDCQDDNFSNDSRNSVVDPLFLFKMESRDSFSGHQEEVMSLKASETLEESEQELTTAAEDVEEIFYGKNYIITGESGPSQLAQKNMEAGIIFSQGFEKSTEEMRTSFAYITSNSSTSIFHSKEKECAQSLNLAIDGNISVLSGDTLIIPQLLPQLGSAPEESDSWQEFNRMNMSESYDEPQMFPLASTSGLQNVSSLSPAKKSEDEDYDFEYESDCYGDSDSDACIGQRSPLDLEKWRCNKCNKTFKSLKEKLLHAGHHSPCFNEQLSNSNASVIADSNCEKRKSKSLMNYRANAKDVKTDAERNGVNKMTCEKVFKMEEVISEDFGESALESLKTIDGRSQCVVCLKIFNTPDEVYNHRVSFLKSNLACGLCHKEFSQRINKLMHLKTHPASDFKCPMCHVTFNTHYLWCQHQLFHLDLKFFDCNRCGRKFQRKGELVIHMRRHTGERPFKCMVCKKSFTTNQTLKKHLLIHMEDQEVSCDICDKVYKNSLSLSKHKLNVHPKKKKLFRKRTDYMCQVCGEVFFSDKKLKWHQETHERWPKKCQQCGECFVHQANLTKHIRQKHDPSHIPKGEKETNCVKCPVCEKMYQRSSLSLHMLTHNGIKPYKCNVCDKSFAVKCNYLTHKWVHMGPRDRPFKCKLCDKSFQRKKSLEAHVHSHKNIRPYTCNECGKSFIYKNNLQTHLREHSGDKKHVCETCGMAFFRKYNLNNHIRVHTRVTPYSCNLCSKKFTQKSNYNVHMKAFHSERHAIQEEI